MATKKNDGTVQADVRAEVLGETEGAVVPVAGPQPHAVSTLGGVTGVVDASDIRFPDLQIAYGVGALSQTFSPGDLVMGKDQLVCHKNEQITATFLGVHTYFKQWLTQEQYAAGLQPMEFADEAAARAAGMTLEWTGPAGLRIAPTVSKAANISLLIAKPEKLECEMFALEIAGKRWAPVRMRVDKMAYGALVPDIITMQTMALKSRGLMSGLFSLWVTVTPKGNKTSVLPHTRLVGHHTNEDLEQLKKLFLGA